MKKLLTLSIFITSTVFFAQEKVVNKNGKEITVQNPLTVTTTGSGAATFTPSTATLNIPTPSISGTTNYISKFSSSTALGNSQLFDNGTNIGIGTITPGAKFQIVGATSGNNTIDGSGSLVWFKQTGTWGMNAPYTLWVDGYSMLGGFRINAADGQRTVFNSITNAELGFGTNGGNITFSYGNGINRGLTFLNSNGNLGLGTTTPNAKLEISSGTTGSSGLRFTNLTNATVGASAFSGLLGVNSSGDVGIGTVAASSLSGLTAGQALFGSTTGSIAQSTNFFWDNTNSRLGIGTNAPTSRLSVVETVNSSAVDQINVQNLSNGISAAARFTLQNDASDKASFFIPSSTNNGIGTAGQASFTGTKGIVLITDSNVLSGGTNTFSVRTGGYGAVQERMRIDANGNMGIGTTAPATKLEITSGTTGSSGLRFTNLTNATAGSSTYSTLLGVNSTGDVGPGAISGNSFTGFTDKQLLYGNATGGFTQSSNLVYDYTNNRFGVSAPTPAVTFQIGSGIGRFEMNNTGNADTSYMGMYDSGNNVIYGIRPSMAAALNNPSNIPVVAIGGWYKGLGIYTATAKDATTTPAFGVNASNQTGGAYGVTKNLFNVQQNAVVTTFNNVLDDGTGKMGIGLGLGVNPNAKLEINSGTSGVSGLRFTNLTSSATPSSSSNFLSLDASGNVIYATSGATLPLINANGTNSSTTEVRDYNVWANRGNGFYLTDNSAAISNPIPNNGAWFALSQVAKGASVFGQTSLNDQGFWFRGGATSTIASNTWQRTLSLNANSRFAVQWDNSTNNTITLNNIDNGPLLFSTNNSERMRILANGNVGIGTTTPLMKLHVTGTNAQPASSGTTSNATFRVDGNTNHALDMGTFTNSPFGSYIQSVDKTNLANNLPLNLNPVAGNVGIGTNNPQSKLEVKGSATNTTAAGFTTTTIDFSQSNLAYTISSAGAMTLQGIKDGGTYTLAVQGTTSGTSTFTCTPYTFRYVNNGATAASKHTLYTFLVMGTNVYVYMATGF